MNKIVSFLSSYSVVWNSPLIGRALDSTYLNLGLKFIICCSSYNNRSYPFFFYTSMYCKRGVTINVAVKCPEGLVMGCDSLTTITDSSDNNIVASVPYISKLFSLGDTKDTQRNFPVGIMINGVHSIGGVRVEDIIFEFKALYAANHSPTEYAVSNMGKELAQFIDAYIESVMSQKKTVGLEVIVAGFSQNKAKTANKYGEIYSYIWENSRKHRPREVTTKESEFDTFYGGQTAALDRIRYGIDDWILFRMLERKHLLFEQTQYYIDKELKKKSINIPQIWEINEPKNMSEYNIFKLFSSGKPGKTVGETIKNIKEGMKDRLQTMEGWFSLQTAINYCSFLMFCAYAHSSFSYVIPVVGSEMRIASITRHEGFQFRRIWEIQTPSPPFR
jgi:hypothetical protein